MPAAVRFATAATLLTVADAPFAVAQQAPDKPAIGALGAAVIHTRAVGALGNNIGSGYGLVGTFLLPLDPAGVVSLRADVGAAQYGSDTKRTAFSETVGGRVTVNVRTSNTVAPASLGMQLTLPGGPIRPYVNAGAGALWFYTETSVEPIGEGPALASTVNQSDVAFGWTLGGGFYVPLKARRAGTPARCSTWGCNTCTGARRSTSLPGGSSTSRMETSASPRWNRPLT
jgi:hypothetical protein